MTAVSAVGGKGGAVQGNESLSSPGGPRAGGDRRMPDSPSWNPTCSRSRHPGVEWEPSGLRDPLGARCR